MSNKNLLFICSRNQWRSPTAEKVFRDLGYSTRSAGTSPNARHTVTAKDLQWADHIFVMESKHRDRIRASFARLVQYKKIHVLDVPDEYQYMDQELINLLKDSVPPCIN
ncbi:Predicted protein tyrosine phosphatase [Alteromonadaceae bacterium Bs31]|nr:Predicted protein tyrosine phosphatase [Alteromonadaceae bacterium Bs31]